MEENQLPPPPYSETDIYSHSETSSSHILTPASSQTGDSVIASSSPVSPNSETIPLYSPSDSIHGDHIREDDFDHISSSSASAYFESRQPQSRTVFEAEEIRNILVTSRTQPGDLPYVEAWLENDISQQDWATFLNYLLPGHATEVNNSIADRKLRAELIDERMQMLDIEQNVTPVADISQVDAQLDHLRRAQTWDRGYRFGRMEATVAEWNEGFFKPRGLQIKVITATPDVGLSQPLGESPVPTASIPWEQEIESSGANTKIGTKRGLWNGLRPSNADGWRMGPFVANSEGFRIGHGIVANNEGLRLGRMFVADQNGVRVGGNRGFVADARGMSLGGRAFGRRESHDHCGGRNLRAQHRGRSKSHRRYQRRGRSTSSDSLSSSSSSGSSSSGSSRSEFSVGSLPDYDDLKDEQLTVAKQSLTEWLHHPEQPISRALVQQIRQDIDTAKESPGKLDQDLKPLRKEVKILMKEFKESKKVQKSQMKEARRERRSIRRTLKKKIRKAQKKTRKTRRGEEECPRDSKNNRFMDPGHRHLPGPSVYTPGPISPSASPAYIPPVATMRAFPFGRASSVPFLKPSNVFDRRHHRLPGATAMHGSWVYTRDLPYTPGGISVPHDQGWPTPISHGAEQIHSQAIRMERAARVKETAALKLYAAATECDTSEREKANKVHEATRLEEEAKIYRREAERLRAEVLQLDSEVAREFEENGDQLSGIVPN